MADEAMKKVMEYKVFVEDRVNELAELDDDPQFLNETLGDFLTQVVAGLEDIEKFRCVRVDLRMWMMAFVVRSAAAGVCHCACALGGRLLRFARAGRFVYGAMLCCAARVARGLNRSPIRSRRNQQSAVAWLWCRHATTMVWLCACGL